MAVPARKRVALEGSEEREKYRWTARRRRLCGNSEGGGIQKAQIRDFK